MGVWWVHFFRGLGLRSRAVFGGVCLDWVWVYPTLIRDPGLVGWVKPGAAAWPVRTGD